MGPAEGTSLAFLRRSSVPSYRRGSWAGSRSRHCHRPGGDFNVSDDTIHLARAALSKVGKARALKQGAFWTEKRAHDGDVRIIYDRAKGVLYYDPDGIGSARQIKSATISKNVKMSYKDLFVI